MKQISVGDAVLFEGLPHRVTELRDAQVEFASDLTAEVRGKTVPRFRTAANAADLRWSDELGAWYLWGRLLGSVRGCGVDQVDVVRKLRDAMQIPARATRQVGSAPAGGEHLNLYLSLFRSGVDWAAELANLSRRKGLSAAAAACCDDYVERFKAPLADGFADPGANDSTGEEV